MAQEIINVGATADDGTGDDLRVGFIKTNTNFDQIWAAGPVGSNITVLNNTVSVTNTNGNLILSPNGVGIIQTNRHLYPRLDNTYELGSSNLRYRSLFVGSGGITNNGNLTLGNISNLKIPGGQNGYIIQTDGAANLSWVAMPGAGNGSPGGSTGQIQFNDGGLFGGSGNLTFNKNTGSMAVVSVNTDGVFTDVLSVNSVGNAWGIGGNALQAPSGASWVSNDDTLDDYISSAVDGFLNLQTFDSSSNLAAQFHLEHGLAHINILNGVDYTWEFNNAGLFSAPGNIEAIGNITGNYFLGDGSQLVNLPGGVIQGNIPPVSPNDTTLWWDDVTGRLYVWYDDGSGLQWVDAAPAGPAVTYGNSNVASFLASGNNSANIVTTGGIVAVSVETNTITSGDSTLVVVNDGLQVVGDIIPDTSNVYSLGSSTNQWADLYVANATIYMNNVPISLGAGNVLTVNGNAVLTNNSNTTVSTTGNVTANYFFGNGSQLTGLPSPTVTQDISSTGAMSLMTYDGTIKYVSYATVEPASGNLTVGNISTTGNIAANNFIGLLGNITNLDSLNFAVENISALVGNNGVNIGAGGNNNLVVLPTDVLIQNVPLTVAGNIISTVAGGLNITANTVANGTAQTWNFSTDGRLTLPNAGNIAVGGTAQVGSELAIATNDSGGLTGWGSQALSIAYDPNVISTYPVGSTIIWQDGTTATITGWDDYGPTYIDLFWDTPKTGTLFPITLQTSAYAPAVPLKQWTFGLNGNLTAPGNVSAVGNITGGIISSTGNVYAPAIVNNGTYNTKIELGSASGIIAVTTDGNATQFLPGGQIRLNGAKTIYGGDLDGSQLVLGTAHTNLVQNRDGNVTVEVGTGGSTTSTWTFTNSGNLIAPGNISAMGNVSGNYFLGNIFYANGITTNQIYNGTSNVSIPTANGNVLINTSNSYLLSNVAVNDVALLSPTLIQFEILKSSAPTLGSLVKIGATVSDIADPVHTTTVQSAVTEDSTTWFFSLLKTWVDAYYVSNQINISGSDSPQWIFDTDGNTTLPGDITTTGNISVDGSTNISNVTINSYTSVPQLWFKGQISSPQNVITSTDTVTLWNDNTDPQSWGNVTTGHIVPDKSGWYEIISRVEFDTNNVANSQQQINHQIAVNGNQQAISQLPNLTGNVPVSMIATAMVEINGSTDYITTTSWSGIAGNAQQINGGNASLLIVRWVST